METMKRVDVVNWLQSQGMPQAAAQFSDLFDEIEYISYGGVRGFLHIIYGTGDDEYIFRKMQCDVATTLRNEFVI